MGTLGSYGSLARFTEIQRVIKVNETTMVGAGGDFADFQFLSDIIRQKQIDEECADDGFSLKPKALHCWLTRVLYNRRSKFDPLWNSILVGGMQEGKPFLGCVDMIGTAWQENAIATGIGAAMAIPIINHEMEKIGSHDNLTKEQAREIILKCIRVCYLRDCKAMNKYYISTINAEGAEVEG